MNRMLQQQGRFCSPTTYQIFTQPSKLSKEKGES